MIKNISELWPCIQTDGLKIFSTTADQRYLLGEELFLNTHYPLTFRRFRPGEIVEMVSELDIFNRLITPMHECIGNRVFIIYGAAGSGKSEFIRWLQLMVEKRDKHRAETTIRIPRTELDVLSITERFQHLLSQKFFSEATHTRWEEARRKPRTLAKLLLLTALERTLDSDELINALYYRLLEWIQPRISRILNTTHINIEMPVEVLTREDLEQLKAETSLPTPLDYEQFRYQVLLALRENLLEGVHLPTTLRLISDDMTRKGYRPLLLIDDLVQSVNLFATDLLDYFITLESGSWDVIVGLTPDALTESKRGREILDRITYLDTVDDRVEKLWLSDMQGHDSYFLSNENCVDFAAKYLDTFRAQNGWNCFTCHRRLFCQELGTSENGNHSLLAPFSPLLLRRIYHALPENKGRARQFLLRLKELLDGFIQSQELIPTLTQYMQPEQAVDAEEPFMARLAELYGPMPEDGQTIMKGALLTAFGLPNKSITLRAQSLQIDSGQLQQYSVMTISDQDPSRLAIKSWLDGYEVNRQSLLPLRRGIARWLRMTCFNIGLHASGIATPHEVLRPHKVYLGVTPPIILEGVDRGEGILISRSLGLDAFLFQEFAAAQGNFKNKLLLELAQSEHTEKLIYQTISYKQHLIANLEAQITTTLEKFAFIIYLWSLIFRRGRTEITIPGIDPKIITVWKKQKPLWLSNPDSELVKWSGFLFEDFFKFRDNVFNGPSISRLMIETTLENLFSTLLIINTNVIDPDYFLGNKQLGNALYLIQESIRQWQGLSSDNNLPNSKVSALLESLNKAGRKGVLLNQFPMELWKQLEIEKPDIFSSLHVITPREKNI